MSAAIFFLVVGFFFVFLCVNVGGKATEQKKQTTKAKLFRRGTRPFPVGGLQPERFLTWKHLQL